MRVTANTFPNSLLDQLTNLSVRQNRLQQQAATGQRIRLPEDDPVATRRVLDLQTEGRTLAQYERNIARHQELAASTFSSLKGLKKISDRAGEIAISADNLKSPEELRIYALEVNELIKQAAQQTNAQNRGDYIFGGTRTDIPPFAVTEDGDGNVTAVTYQGNTDQAESEVAEDVTLTVQIVGENGAGAGPRGLVSDNRSGADFFNHLIALRDHLAAGDTTAIASTDRQALASDEENFLLHVGANGVLQSRLEASLSVAKLRGETVGALVSREVDADLAQTIVKLTQSQTAYEAALQSGGRILSSSLLDYLR